jgi:hypothetical protein
MGSFAHIWELAGGTLVGASNDAFSDYAVTSDAQQVGDFSSLDLESILALDPDFVIMTSAGSGRPGAASQTELADSLRQAGITVACFTVTTFDDYLSMLKTCTDITGRADLYQQNGTAVADRIAAIKAQVPQGTSPTVMAGITYSGGMRVQGSKTMVGGIVSELGGTNISDSHPSLISDYSVESVIDADPRRHPARADGRDRRRRAAEPRAEHGGEPRVGQPHRRPERPLPGARPEAVRVQAVRELGPDLSGSVRCPLPVEPGRASARPSRSSSWRRSPG